MDPEDVKMIEVEIEEGSRSITIPIDRGLQKNTEDMVNALGSLYSKFKRVTLKELSDDNM